MLIQKFLWLFFFWLIPFEWVLLCVLGHSTGICCYDIQSEIAFATHMQVHNAINYQLFQMSEMIRLIWQVLDLYWSLMSDNIRIVPKLIKILETNILVICLYVAVSFIPTHIIITYTHTHNTHSLLNSCFSEKQLRQQSTIIHPSVLERVGITNPFLCYISGESRQQTLQSLGVIPGDLLFSLSINFWSDPIKQVLQGLMEISISFHFSDFFWLSRP